jgi:hypothetical protein
LKILAGTAWVKNFGGSNTGWSNSSINTDKTTEAFCQLANNLWLVSTWRCLSIPKSILSRKIKKIGMPLFNSLMKGFALLLKGIIHSRIVESLPFESLNAASEQSASQACVAAGRGGRDHTQSCSTGGKDQALKFPVWMFSDGSSRVSAPLQILSLSWAQHHFETKRSTRGSPSLRSLRLGFPLSLASWEMGHAGGSSLKYFHSSISGHSKSSPLKSGEFESFFRLTATDSYQNLRKISFQKVPDDDLEIQTIQLNCVVYVID